MSGFQELLNWIDARNDRLNGRTTGEQRAIDLRARLAQDAALDAAIAALDTSPRDAPAHDTPALSDLLNAVARDLAHDEGLLRTNNIGLFSVASPYLSGAPVPGFYGFAEADFGDPQSPQPYPQVVAHGGLTVVCPRCSTTTQFRNAAHRECFRDHRRGSAGNYWCPTCACRFFLRSCACAVCPPTAPPHGLKARQDRYLRSIDLLGDLARPRSVSGPRWTQIAFGIGIGLLASL